MMLRFMVWTCAVAFVSLGGCADGARLTYEVGQSGARLYDGYGTPGSCAAEISSTTNPSVTGSPRGYLSPNAGRINGSATPGARA